MTKIYDVVIVGTGIAGTLACLKLSQQYPEANVLAIEMGRPPHKRRMQMCGWLGILPNSDGKFFKNDIKKVSALINLKKIKPALAYVEEVLSNVGDYAFIKDKTPSKYITNKLKKIGYNIELNDYLQMYPKEIHALSKWVVEKISNNKNIDFSFDNEVYELHKNKGIFTITTELGDFKAKKVVLAAGRIGSPWITEIFNKFGLIEENDIAKFGFRIEMDSGFMKDFNESNCSLFNDNIEIGPLSWNGTIIPEDHFEFAVSAFRGNESRWKSDKVSFSFLGNRSFDKRGFEEADRLGKLTFILTNDRILKEKISTFMNGRSKISILHKEYDWLKDELKDFAQVIPELITKGYFHIPTILPIAPAIKINKHFSTEVEGLYVIGETAGITGLLSASLMGSLIADTVLEN